MAWHKDKLLLPGLWWLNCWFIGLKMGLEFLWRGKGWVWYSVCCKINVWNDWKELYLGIESLGLVWLDFADFGYLDFECAECLGFVCILGVWTCEINKDWALILIFEFLPTKVIPIIGPSKIGYWIRTGNLAWI